MPDRSHPVLLRHRLAVVLAALTLLAAGTAPSPEAEPVPPRTLSAPDYTTAVEAWSHDVTPISSPLVIDEETFVLHTESGGQLTLAAFDARNGSLLWERPSAPGGVHPGRSEVTPVAVAVDPDDEDSPVAVVHVAPEPEDASQTLRTRNRLVAIDSATGETISRTEPISLASSPAYCEAIGGICVEVRTGEEQTGTFRLDVATGEHTSVEIPVGGEADGAGIGGRYTDDDIELVRVVDDDVTWHLPLDEMTDGARVAYLTGQSNIDGGCTAVTIRPRPPDAPTGVDHLRTRLEDHVMVLLDLETGEVRWSGTGYTLCPTELYPAAVRCRASGAEVVTADGARRFGEIDLTLEGFDPETGETTWETPLGADRTLLVHDVPFRLDGELLVRTQDGVQVLDPDTGELSAVSAGTYLCGTTARFEYHLPWRDDDDVGEDWNGSEVSRTCTERGRSTDGSPELASIRADGRRAAGLWVLAYEDRVVAYRPR